MKHQHKQLVKLIKQVERAAEEVKTPYSNIRIRTCDGGLLFRTHNGDLEVEYTAREAVRIAKWILKYYGEEPEEIFI